MTALKTKCSVSFTLRFIIIFFFNGKLYHIKTLQLYRLYEKNYINIKHDNIRFLKFFFSFEFLISIKCETYNFFNVYRYINKIDTYIKFKPGDTRKIILYTFKNFIKFKILRSKYK